MFAVVLPLSSPTAEAATTRVLAITNALANPQVPFATFDGNPPKVFDINGDGKLEIIAQNDNNWFYVFDSQTGKILFQAKTTFPGSWGARTFNGPEVSILKEGGVPSIVVMNSAAYLTKYRYDHAGSTSSAFKFVKEWEKRLNTCYSNPGSDSKPTLYDLDMDGDLEIIATTEENGIYAVRSEGTVLWHRCIYGGNAEAVAADIDLDGKPEVVFGSDGGVVTAMNGQTGQTLPGWPFYATQYNIGSGSMPVGPAIGQLDGTGGLEIVIGARDSHDATNFDNNNALLLALKNTGAVLWAKQDPAGNPLTYTHPIIVDADKDGKNEVYWGDWNTMGHKPPWDPALAWQVTGPANFYRYAADGTLVWKKTLGTWWSNKDLSIGDVDGDGVQDVLANGPIGGHDGLIPLNVTNGAAGPFIDTYPWKVARGPILADLWNTKTMQIVIGTGHEEGNHAVLVYDTGKPYNSVYPHLPYVTKARSTGPQPTLQATFTPKSLGNPEWVEVQVTSSSVITKAYAKINDGPWYLLSQQASGTWGRALSAPLGSTLVFRAFNAANEYATSNPFTWTARPTPTLEASFTPRSLGNPDWVEVEVTSASTITRAYAKINDGPWYGLDPQSSGTWGRALSAPQGATVVFRAFNAANEYATSSPYTWTVRPTPTLEATFNPMSVGSDNWVEVDVTSTSTITRAYAKVNDGPWYLLTQSASGTWGRALSAPDGSTVIFRAFNAQNEYATSSTYTWT